MTVQGDLVAPGTALTRPTSREIRVVEDELALMDTGKFEHMQRVASLMAANSFLPDHLILTGPKNDKQLLPANVIAANCFRIVNQAMRWGFDPFAIIDFTYVKNGRLGYLGQLVLAVVNARAGLQRRLKFEFSGSGNLRKVRCVGRFIGEDEDRDADLTLEDAKTDHFMWQKDPDQKLIYSVVMKWSRRHCPEVVMGVLTDDDVERMARESETPPGHNLNDRLRIAQLEQQEAAANPGQAALPSPSSSATPSAQSKSTTTERKPAKSKATAEHEQQSTVAGGGAGETGDAAASNDAGGGEAAGEGQAGAAGGDTAGAADGAGDGAAEGDGGGGDGDGGGTGDQADKADEEAQQPAPIETYAEFSAQLTGIGAAKGKTPPQVNALVSTLGLKTKIKVDNKEMKLLRRQIVDAAAAGKLNWTTGEIRQ